MRSPGCWPPSASSWSPSARPPGTSGAPPVPRRVSLNGNDFLPSEPVRQHHPVDTYTHGHADPVLQSHRWRTVENSAGYIAPHLRAGLDLLDVGCGPGTITVDLAGRVAPGGRVVGLDVSSAPLDEARDLAVRS